MGGFFGVVSKTDCVTDLFFGTDYHSHLGAKRAGMAVCDGENFKRAIHNIESAPFRSKFEGDLSEMHGHMGIGCISDSDPQPLIFRSKLGSFAVTTVGCINNARQLMQQVFENQGTQFLEMSNGRINQTELVCALINQKDSIEEGILHAQKLIEGSLSLLVMTKTGMYAARDRFGRTPIIIGKRQGAMCAAFESFAYFNLGYSTEYELGPGQLVFIESDSVKTVSPAREQMKICAFLWTYYGYPTSSYEGVNVEEMRYRCGASMAKDDDTDADFVAGVPDSGTAHAIGYSNASDIAFARPFIKYTPTWPRSFMPQEQSMRALIAKMKIIPVKELINGRNLLFIDDSIVRGTQMGETADFLFSSGAKKVHIRPACPPIMYSCKYLNFSRSTSENDLIARRVIRDLEGNGFEQKIGDYVCEQGEKHKQMVDCICKKLGFSSLKYQTMDKMLESIGIDKCKICTYCWTGQE